MFPPHIHYVEPYAGGLAVLFAKPVKWIEGHSEVVNDLNSGLTNFWSCLRDPDSYNEFKRLCDLTALDETVFSLPEKFEDDSSVGYFSGDSSVTEAWRFFVRFRQSRQGLGKDFATLSRNRTRRGMNEQVSSWLSAVEGLRDAHERLRRVVVLNRDAIDVIKSQDGPNTLIYADPPYKHETRVTTSDYAFEMTDSEHSDLLVALGGVEGKFILSGYRSDLYLDAEREYGWKRHEIQIDNKASSSKLKEIKTECLWSNY